MKLYPLLLTEEDANILLRGHDASTVRAPRRNPFFVGALAAIGMMGDERDAKLMWRAADWRCLRWLSKGEQIEAIRPEAFQQWSEDGDSLIACGGDLSGNWYYEV